MSSAEAWLYGWIAAGPLLTFAGAFFALAICMSEYHNIVGKAFALPLSPIIGMQSGAYWGSELLPDWGYWGVAWFFGPGFFAVWALVGFLTHDDAIHIYIQSVRSVAPKVLRTIRRIRLPRLGSDTNRPPHRTYRGRAGTRQPDRETR